MCSYSWDNFFFFFVVLQKGQPTQYTTSICGLIGSNGGLDEDQLVQKLTDLQSDDHDGHQHNHIDQVIVMPQDQRGNYSCVVVIYSPAK